MPVFSTDRTRDSRNFLIARVPSRKERQLGVHGARGTGKTCYFACLYGHRAKENASIVFNNDHSLDHLNIAWKILESGGVPEATALTLPTELSLSLHADGLSWDIPTRDYAGALVQRSETGVPELKKEVKAWLGGCHGVLLFINCDADDLSLRERHDELDLLISELMRLSSDGNTISRPLAIMLTKWDIVAKWEHRPDISQDYQQERQAAYNYLRSRPVLKQIADSVRQCGDRVEVFPVSSFGFSRECNKPPASGPQPFGLLEPLIWIAHKTDEMLLERARCEAEKYAGAQLRWWQKRYGKAVDCYRKLERVYGINKGPTHQLAKREESEWRTKLYRRRTWQGFVLLAGFAALTTGLMLWEEQNSRDRALVALNDASLSPQDVYRVCEQYLTSRNPITRWLGHRDKIQRSLDSYRTGKEDQDYHALREYRDKNNNDEFSDARRERCQEFLKRWPSSKYAATVREWEADDKQRSDEHRGYLNLDDRKAQLDSNLQRYGNNYEKAIPEMNDFLREFPKEKFPKRRAKIEEIEQKLKAYKKAIDDKDWAAVVTYEQQNPNNFDEIIRRARDYLNNPQSAHRQEASEMISRTERRWDQSEYEKVRQAARALTNAESLDAAEQAARRYVEGSHPLKQRKRAVNEWLRWCDGLKQERNYFIQVKSIVIPDDSDLAESTVTEDVRVHIELNGVRHSTGWYKGRRPQINERLGPFRFRWGEEGLLRVEVEEYDNIGPNDWAKGEAKDHRFVIMRANGTFVATCSKGKDIPVYLECPDVVPPNLEPYPSR